MRLSLSLSLSLSVCVCVWKPTAEREEVDVRGDAVEEDMEVDREARGGECVRMLSADSSRPEDHTARPPCVPSALFCQYIRDQTSSRAVERASERVPCITRRAHRFPRGRILAVTVVSFLRLSLFGER